MSLFSEPKKQLMKTTNVRKTKPDETKAWFRSAFMPSSQEIHYTGLFHNSWKVKVKERIVLC